MATTGHQPITVERLERALVLMAHVVGMDGEVYLPIFNRLETELQTSMRQRDTMARARQIVESYTSRGGVKAIR